MPRYVRQDGQAVSITEMPAHGHEASNVTFSGSGLAVITGVSDIQLALEAVDAALVDRPTQQELEDSIKGLREILTFTTDGSFVKANYPWLRAVRVRVQAGGGGGAGTAAAGSGEVAAGSGGRGGGYAESFILASLLNASEAVTVGSGGSGGTAGANDGSNGGDSSFGSHVSAEGGARGLTRPSPSGLPIQWSGVESAQGGTGDLVIPGGGAPLLVWVEAVGRAISGGGGDSFLGKGAHEVRAGGASPNSGRDGELYGGGGGSGATSQNHDAQVGGDGGDGVVIVELYG